MCSIWPRDYSDQNNFAQSFRVVLHKVLLHVRINIVYLFFMIKVTKKSVGVGSNIGHKSRH